MNKMQVVGYDETFDLTVEWNGSATFNVYNERGQNTDCMTNYSVYTLQDAKDFALSYFEQIREEMYEFSRRVA